MQSACGRVTRVATEDTIEYPKPESHTAYARNS